MNYVPETRSGEPIKPSKWFVPLGDGFAPTAHALPDEHNRDPELTHWARVRDASHPDGEHWAEVGRAHGVDVQIEFETRNRWEFHDWKGFNNLRPGGSWSITLNGNIAWTGRLHGTNYTSTLLEIIKRLDWLLGPDCKVNWSHGENWDSLAGRKIFYREIPAVIEYAIPDQQSVIIRRDDGEETFPSPVWADHDDEDPGPINDSVTSPNIWWWRE